MNRYVEIKNIIINCCNASAINYNGLQSIKLLEDSGTIIYIEKSRMLDICEFIIPNYNKLTDIKIIKELEAKGIIKWCESHKYRDEYCLSIILL